MEHAIILIALAAGEAVAVAFLTAPLEPVNWGLQKLTPLARGKLDPPLRVQTIRLAILGWLAVTLRLRLARGRPRLRLTAVAVADLGL